LALKKVVPLVSFLAMINFMFIIMYMIDVSHDKRIEVVY